MAELIQGADAPILLAFSGGLDTSFCVPWLAETLWRARSSRSRSTPAASTPRQRRRSRRARWRSARPRTTAWMRAACTSSACSSGCWSATCVAASSTRSASAPSARCRRRSSRRMACDARHRHDRARLHGGGQRPGALRGGAADARARHRDPRAGARPRPSSAPSSSPTSKAHGLPVPPHRRRLLHQPRPLGRHDRRARDADVRGQHPGIRLGAVPARLRRAARAAADSRSRSNTASRSRSTARRWTRSRSSRPSRRPPARSASAAASTSATRSSAPRAASPSRRRRPPC